MYAHIAREEVYKLLEEADHADVSKQTLISYSEVVRLLVTERKWFMAYRREALDSCC